jgi:hypothetical protein
MEGIKGVTATRGHCSVEQGVRPRCGHAVKEQGGLADDCGQPTRSGRP